MFTEDWFQMDPVPKSDRIDLLFTRDRSGTSPEWIQMDPKLDLQNRSIWIRSGLVPERSHVNTWIASKLFHVNRS